MCQCFSTLWKRETDGIFQCWFGTKWTEIELKLLSYVYFIVLCWVYFSGVADISLPTLGFLLQMRHLRCRQPNLAFFGTSCQFRCVWQRFSRLKKVQKLAWGLRLQATLNYDFQAPVWSILINYIYRAWKRHTGGFFVRILLLMCSNYSLPRKNCPSPVK